MKWLDTIYVVAAVVAGTIAAASPMSGRVLRPYEPPLYRLRISARQIEALNGRYLSLSNNTVGVYEGGSVSTALRFYTIQSRNKTTFELHTWPIGFVDHALALVGPPDSGLFAFQDLTNPHSDPAGSAVGQDQPATFTDFVLGGPDPETGREVSMLSFGPGKSRWVAFPRANGEWEIKWYDGKAFVTADYQRIEIAYEPTDKDAVAAPPTASRARKGW
jgi:hypothetical protein